MKNAKKYFLKIISRSIIVVLILFLSVFALFQTLPEKIASKKAIVADSDNLPLANKIILYSISGKIKNIENNKIQLETLTADSITKPLSEKKLEIRELEIGEGTKIARLNFIPRKEGVKMPENPTADSFGSLSSFSAEYAAATINDLNIGDNISADYSSNLAEIKNFTPKTITILPYTVY